MPVSFIRLPAKINMGIASRAKFCVSERTSCTGMVKGRMPPCCRKKVKPEMPMAKATGIPVSNRTAKTISTKVIVSPPLPFH